MQVIFSYRSGREAFGFIPFLRLIGGMDWRLSAGPIGEERKIPIMPTLRKILERRKVGPGGLDLPVESYVFGNETGDEMHRRRLCALWLDTCARAKVKNLHLHDLRGEAGSQLLEAGVPIHELREALGHSSTTMTSTLTCIAHGRRCDWLVGANQVRSANRLK
jgi:integrase